MINSMVVWKMSMLYLLREWKQTLIVILGGCIGAILIGLSFSFYYSLDRSGADYLQSHYGDINWEITTKNDTGRSTPEQISLLTATMNQTEAITLPIIKQDVKIKGGTQNNILSDIQLISFDPVIAAQIEPDQLLWKNSLKSNELIIDKKTADTAGLKMNQAVELINSRGISTPFRVAIIAEERGISGYRYGAARGTVIVSLEAARKISEYPDGEWSAVLVSSRQVGDVFPIVLDKSLYNIENVKANAKDQINDLKSSYGIIFVLLASIAILSGMLLLSQILLMQSKARAKQHGIFRAIGMSKNQIRILFFSETAILTLLQSAIGTLSGVFGGIGLVRLYYIHFGKVLEGLSGLTIPIKSYWSWGIVVFAFGFIFIIQLLITGFASWKVGKQPILELILGSSQRADKTPNRVIKLMLILLCSANIIAHFYYAASGKGTELLQGPLFIWVDFIWISACASLVLMITTHISGIFNNLLCWFEKAKINDFPFFLASKYPGQDKKQTFIITFLFTLVVLVTTSAIIITSTQNQYNDVDKTTQSILGFGGQVAYKTNEQNIKAVRLVQNDPELRQNIYKVIPLESYQLIIEQGKIPNTILPVTEAWASATHLKLAAKISKYASDRDTWKAVLNDKSAIILDVKFMKNENNGNFVTGIRSTFELGQEINLPVYENKLRGEQDKWEPLVYKKFTVIGFSESSIEKNVSNQFYNATFINPEVFKELQKYGFVSDEYPYKGYLLLDFNYKDIRAAQMIKDRLTSNGFQTVYLPYLENGMKNYMSRQIINVFIGFMIFTALVAVSGLLIVQIRAVQMRTKQIAMMRCIGISVKQIMHAFFYEGMLLSGIGVFAGVLFGSTGGYMYVKVIQQSAVAAHLEIIPFTYPYLSVGITIFIILGASLFINIFPARKTLHIAPGHAILFFLLALW